MVTRPVMRLDGLKDRPPRVSDPPALRRKTRRCARESMPRPSCIRVRKPSFVRLRLERCRDTATLLTVARLVPRLAWRWERIELRQVRPKERRQRSGLEDGRQISPAAVRALRKVAADGATFWPSPFRWVASRGRLAVDVPTASARTTLRHDLAKSRSERRPPVPAPPDGEAYRIGARVTQETAAGEARSQEHARTSADGIRTGTTRARPGRCSRFEHKAEALEGSRERKCPGARPRASLHAERESNRRQPRVFARDLSTIWKTEAPVHERPGPFATVHSLSLLKSRLRSR